MRVSSQRFLASLLVVVLLVSGSAGVALAGDHTSTDSSVTKFGSQDITISDATITISDTDLSGPGFPDLVIDHRNCTLSDATMSIDGLHVSFNGNQYEICHIDVTMDNVRVSSD